MVLSEFVLFIQINAINSHTHNHKCVNIYK